MRLIISGITTLLQHLTELKQHPERYKPSKCYLCGQPSLWNHGHYDRKSDRENSVDASLNPIPIPRFYCPGCKHTCSVLPECIPPRHWYLWKIKQIVLLLLLAGTSATQVSQAHQPSRRTATRWLQGLQTRFEDFRFCLTSKYSELGYYDGFTNFWCHVLEHLGLAKAMVYLNYQGLKIPP